MNKRLIIKTINPNVITIDPISNMVGHIVAVLIGLWLVMPIGFILWVMR